MPTLAYLSDRPDLVSRVQTLGDDAWPEFLHHSDVRNWQSIFDVFPECQFVLLEGDDQIAGVGHCVPLRWDGEPSSLPERIHEIIERALEAREGPGPNTLSALAAIVPHEHRRQGHSERILRGMRGIAQTRNLVSMIAPVRPILKSAHPHEAFEGYIRRVNDEGLLFDPWIRLHAKMGARILRTIPRAIRVEGTVSDWETWSGLSFPASGPYVVEGALQPVQIDTSEDSGVYDDPNVWMLHPV